MGREIHLVGSMPLESAEVVFRTVAGVLGVNALRIPDGETGCARSAWIQCQIPFFLGHPQLECVEPDPKRIRCDMPVEVVFHKLTDEITLPLFQPVGGAA